MYRYFKNQEGKIVTVDQAPWGNYTFYTKPTLKHKGTRIKGRKKPLYFDSFKEALDTLQDYAMERKFTPFII